MFNPDSPSLVMHSNHDPREFSSPAPGYWKDRNVADTDWNDWAWQLQNRVTSLSQLGFHPPHRRRTRRRAPLRQQAGHGHHAALLQSHRPATIPNCPIRRQVIPRIEETWEADYEMADPCGEDSPHARARPRPPLPRPRPLPRDRPLRLLLPLLHPQPRRQRRRRTGTGDRFRGRLPLPRSNTPKSATSSSPAATPSSSSDAKLEKHPRAAPRHRAHRVHPHRLPHPHLSAAADHARSSAPCCRSTIRS